MQIGDEQSSFAATSPTHGDDFFHGTCARARILLLLKSGLVFYLVPTELSLAIRAMIQLSRVGVYLQLEHVPPEPLVPHTIRFLFQSFFQHSSQTIIRPLSLWSAESKVSSSPFFPQSPHSAIFLTFFIFSAFLFTKSVRMHKNILNGACHPSKNATVTSKSMNSCGGLRMLVLDGSEICRTLSQTSKSVQNQYSIPFLGGTP